MSNSIAPGSSVDVNVKVTALTTNPNVPVTYKTIILKKNLVNGVNTLTQDMIFAQNTKYVVKYDYTLGENITIPDNCIFEFDGGSILANGSNDTITGINTVIIGIKCFNSFIKLLGSFKNIEFSLDIYNISNGDNISAPLNVLVQLGKNIIIPQGNYYCDEVDIPILFAGCSIKGSGFHHYNDGGTRLKSSKSSYMFKFANGANNISITDIKFEGDNKGTKCIDGTYGAFNVFQRCGFYNFTSHGIYSRQGLLRIDNIFCGNNDIGLELWSDSTVNNSEFTGGRIPLKISAGGNRLTNIWSNSATECCLLIERQQGENHENTSLANLYIGEVNNTDGNEHPIIQFKGFTSNPVRGIQMINSYIVAAVSQSKICMLDMKYCKEIVLSNLIFRGIGSYTTAQNRTNSAISMSNVEYCNISNCDIRDISGNGILLKNHENTEINICNNSFRDCGMSPINSIDAAVINGTAVSLNISDNIFNSYYDVTYAFEPTDSNFYFENNLIRYPNQKIIGGTYNTSYSYKKYGNNNTIFVKPYIEDSIINNSNINNAKRNFKNTFQVHSTGSGASVDILNIEDYKVENLAYLISVMQAGTSINCVFGILITSSIGASVITTEYNNPGNADNDGIYKKKFVIDNGKLVLELGSAYGPTTWQICITPL